MGWTILSGPADTLAPLIDAMGRLVRARLCASHPVQWAIKPALEGTNPHLAQRLFNVPIAIHPPKAEIVIAALAVGATFMSATMLAMLEARRIAADAARRLMAAMTTAFALGQVAGPLAATGATVESGFGGVLVMAALPLLVAAYLLARGR